MMNKRIAKASWILVCATVVFVLLALINTYSDIYPESHTVRLLEPSIYGDTDYIYSRKICKIISLGIAAQTDSSKRELQDYYSKRLNGYGYFPDLNEFYIFAISDSNYGMFVEKSIWTDSGAPLAYKVYTNINFCKLEK